MCGRYVMARAIGDLVADAEAEADTALELRRSWNVAPTADVPVVLERLVGDRVVRQIHVAKWGLVPIWAKDPSVGVRAFNARSETVLEKPTFRSAIKARRCAIPAEGYYEWKKTGTGKTGTKRPFFVHPEDDSLIYFAGIYEWWKDASKAEDDGDRWLLSCSILTMASPEPTGESEVLDGLHDLHDRLPIPLDRAALAEWLNPGDKEAGARVEQIRAEAYAVAGQWTLREVAPAVGNVRNDGPELTEPLAGLLPE